MVAGHNASWSGLLLALPALSPEALFYLDGLGGEAMSRTPTIGIGTIVYEEGIILPSLLNASKPHQFFVFSTVSIQIWLQPSSNLPITKIWPLVLSDPHRWPSTHWWINQRVVQTACMLINKSSSVVHSIITHIMTKPYYWDSFCNQWPHLSVEKCF